MTLPVDYEDPSMGTFDMAVIRFRDANQHDRLGSLVVNPGGPGVSGIDYALNAQYIIDPDVLEEFYATWMQQGARVLGGCCGLTVPHIEAAARARAAFTA